MAMEHGSGAQAQVQEHIETEATGNFVAKFDNLDLVEK